MQKKNLWLKRAAIVVSDAPNLHMLLRELMRPYQWSVLDATPSVEVAAAAVRNGQADLIIVDDSVAAPSTAQLRYLQNNPITASTPTLAFLLEFHKGEKLAIRKMGLPEVVDKPLTPSKFSPSFSALIRRWETEPFLSIRRANQNFLSGNDQTGLKYLLDIKEAPATKHLVAQSLSLHLRRLHKIKEAEKLMLSVLKNSPPNFGTMLALGDLYMHAAMPALAHRIFSGTRQAYPNSLTMLPDMVQSALLMGKVDLAITYVQEMHENDFMSDIAQSILARLLYSEGRSHEAERALNSNKTLFRRMQSAWGKAETLPTREAG